MLSKFPFMLLSFLMESKMRTSQFLVCRETFKFAAIRQKRRAEVFVTKKAEVHIRCNKTKSREREQWKREREVERQRKGVGAVIVTGGRVGEERERSAGEAKS